MGWLVVCLCECLCACMPTVVLFGLQSVCGSCGFFFPLRFACVVSFFEFSSVCARTYVISRDIRDRATQFQLQNPLPTANYIGTRISFQPRSRSGKRINRTTLKRSKWEKIIHFYFAKKPVSLSENWEVNNLTKVEFPSFYFAFTQLIRPFIMHTFLRMKTERLI